MRHLKISAVMAWFAPAIHVLLVAAKQDLMPGLGRLENGRLLTFAYGRARQQGKFRTYCYKAR